MVEQKNFCHIEIFWNDDGSPGCRSLTKIDVFYETFFLQQKDHMIKKV